MDLVTAPLCRHTDGALFLDVLSRLRDAKGALATFRWIRNEDGPRVALDFWQDLTEQGWTLAILPEALGGLDQPLSIAVLGARELGRTLVPVPYTSNCVVLPAMIRALDDPELAERFTGAQRWWGLAIAPDAGFELVAGADGDRLSGSARLAADVVGAARIVCLATTVDGPALAQIDAADAQITPQELADRRNRGRVVVSDAPAKVLARGAQAESVVSTMRSAQCLADAAEMLGIAETAFGMALDYLGTRRQFGVPIGSFQALQHRAARVFCELECARGLLWKLAETDPDGLAEAGSLAKAEIGRIACFAVAECFQFHGGIAMTDEFDMGLLLKRLRVLDALGGSQSEHEDRLARMWGY